MEIWNRWIKRQVEKKEGDRVECTGPWHLILHWLALYKNKMKIYYRGIKGQAGKDQEVRLYTPARGALFSTGLPYRKIVKYG